MSRIDEIKTRYEEANLNHKSFTSCEVCKYGKRYGALGIEVYCKILGLYFTANKKPPYKERCDECPLRFLEDIPYLTSETERLQAENEQLRRTIAFRDEYDGTGGWCL